MCEKQNMPSRNIVRSDEPNAYYHVYARGSNKQLIFLESADYMYFERLLERYLSVEPRHDKAGLPYPNFRKQIELLGFCFMHNHFHLLVHQLELRSLSKLMQSLLTSYTRYFNLKYKRSGPLFESKYKAAKIDHQPYLEHVIRYIHLNPRYWKTYPYSSYKYIQRDQNPEWLSADWIVSWFSGAGEYGRFVADYESHKAILDEIKHTLADQ
jgi:putative transposase